MQFIHQPLTWAFLLVIVPLLIHLINMMRHRRVKWAAMDFLLKSYKKHRQWVWLKQFLLLLMRMLAVALVVAMLAQLVTLDRFTALFGGRVTHHYVLLDDSYSMSDRLGGASAFDRAKQAVGRIASRAAQQDAPQKITLLRFSQAGRATGRLPEDSVGQVADFNAERVDSNFDVTLEEKRRTFETTQLAVGPVPALRFAQQLMEKTQDENRVLYVVSDFRAKEWDNPAEARGILQELGNNNVELQLINAAKGEQPNLGITEFEPEQRTRAAGVPLFVNVKVKNFGRDTARRVQVAFRSTYFDPQKSEGGEPGKIEGKTDELPPLVIDQIAPGETVLRQVQVYFPTAGQHVVEAILPEDPVVVDNRRWCVVDFPAGVPVLVIDGHPEERNAYFLRSAFEPGRVRTGVAPDVRTPAFLRDAAAEVLAAYHAVYVLGIDRLDRRAADNLEEYVRGGGGAAVFLGPEVLVGELNDNLYRNGQGPFPVSLLRRDVLGPPLADDVPDFVAADHPVFRVFTGDGGGFLRQIAIDQYWRVRDDWQPDPATTTVLATLHNRKPLVVEKKIGEGRLLAFLTTIAPDWNNWALNPTFVVTCLEVQSYLASPRRVEAPRTVGAPLDVHFDAARFQEGVRFALPGARGTASRLVEQRAQRPRPGGATLTASLGRATATGDAAADTGTSGIYEAWLVSAEGKTTPRRFAVNVDPSEGDLAVVAAEALANRLTALRYRYYQADELEGETSAQAGFNWAQLILIVLVLLLVGEQALAYSASYHPAPGGAR